MSESTEYAASRRKFLSLIAILTAAAGVAGCFSSSSIKITDQEPAECPSGLSEAVKLSGVSIPIAMPTEFRKKRRELDIRGTLARRIVISINPAGLPHGSRIEKEDLYLTGLAGTFQAWTQLKTPFTDISVAETPPLIRQIGDKRKQAEIAAVRITGGQIKITRVAAIKVTLAGSVAIDVLMTPGGIAIDETIVKAGDLWRNNKEPVEPEELEPKLVPVRHMAGYDEAAVLIDLKYVLRLRGGKKTYECSTLDTRSQSDARVVILDKDAVRPPLWDLGIPRAVDGDSDRIMWLAMYRPDIGAVRAIFDSPSEANAFATWIRMTQATRVGSYTLGVFDGPDPAKLRPVLPVDKDIVKTFSPLTPNYRERLRVGALGDR